MARHATHVDQRSVLRWWILLLPPALLVAALALLTRAEGDTDEPAVVSRYAADTDAEVGTRPLRRPGAEAGATPPYAVAPAALSERTVQDLAAHVGTPAVLAGRVLGENGRPVAGARVRLASDAGTVPDAAWTDGAGRFRFAGVPAGRLDVSAEATGCGPAWVRDVVAGTWVELRLTAAARLEVEVRGPTEDRVPGAVVRVRRPGFEREAVTDAQGRVVLVDLPVGVAELRVRAADGASAAQVVALDAEQVATVVCELPRAGRVGGRVVEADSGRPVVGARVTLRAAGAAAADDPSGLTDGAGAFELVDAFPRDARIEVVATKAGYAGGRARPAERAVAVEVVLTPQRQLEGRAIDARGRPVASARIAWAASVDGVVAVSDVRGRFQVPLPAAPSEGGPYALLATTRGGGYGAAAVRLGAAGEPIVVIVRASGRVSGRVLDGAGRGLSGALVTLAASPAYVPSLAASGDEAWARQRGLAATAHDVRAVSDADGAYRLPRVPAGAWAVRVVRGAADERPREPLLLSAGADVSLDLTVGGVDALYGRVVDEAGRGVPDARVLAIGSREAPTASAGGVTTSGADGRYRLDGLRADERLDLVVSARGHAPERLHDVAPGGRALDVQLAAADRVTGRVEQGGLPYGAAVELWLVPGVTEREADGPGGAIPVPAERVALTRIEDAGGRFTLDLPRAGDWLVCARASDGGAVAAPVPVHVDAGRGARDLVLRLDASAILRGRLGAASSAGARPRPGAVVSLHPWAGHGALARPLAATRARADGTFELGDLPAGAYRLRVLGVHGEASAYDVSLTPGAVLELDLGGPSRP